MIDDLIKVVLLLLTGAGGTWLTQILRSRSAKKVESTGAERAEWELWRDQMGYLKTCIKDLQTEIAEVKHDLKETQESCDEMQSYAHALVRWIKATLKVLDAEPNGASILAKVGAPLPDLEISKAKE